MEEILFILDLVSIKFLSDINFWKFEFLAASPGIAEIVKTVRNPFVTMMKLWGPCPAWDRTISL